MLVQVRNEGCNDEKESLNRAYEVLWMPTKREGGRTRQVKQAFGCRAQDHEISRARMRGVAITGLRKG